jgi:hypothetical protein
VPWLPEGDGLRCDVHDQKFGRMGRCAACLSKPVVAQEGGVALDELPAPAPAGCLTVVERERVLTAIAERAERVGWALADTDDDDLRNVPAGAKMLTIAITAHRAAGEYATTRERKDYVARLERQVRKLRGGRN